MSLFAGEQELLSGVSLTVSAGEIVTIIGPNGAGKTTLFRVLLGVIPPNTGSIYKKTKSQNWLPAAKNYCRSDSSSFSQPNYEFDWKFFRSTN